MKQPALPQAGSLAELLQIRAANAAIIERINGHLGSALGYKLKRGTSTGQPAILLFVPTKIPEALLRPSQIFPKTLRGRDGVECVTDVIVGSKSQNEPEPPPLDEENQALVEALASGTTGLMGGVQLGAFENDGTGYVGTAACLVRRKPDQTVGLLTNQHVAGPPGRVIYHPNPGAGRIGHTRASFESDPDEYYFDGLIDEEEAYYRVDCGFVELREQALSIARPGLYKLGNIGDPIGLDLGSMGPIGKKVLSIGRTRGIQRGTIMAFGYEWADDDWGGVYTDYLIIGENGGVFSDHGDSGKLIVADNQKRNAIALLWGGWHERLRKGHGQENWTYAIDINKVLKKLDIEILREPSQRSRRANRGSSFMNESNPVKATYGVRSNPPV